MEDYKIRKYINNSVINSCIFCGSNKCIRSHSISKKQYLQPISENGHVYGSHRAKGLLGLTDVSINKASTFYNFCEKCDSIFHVIDNNKFSEKDDEIFLIYFRALSAQVHQIKEEIKFYKKIESVSILRYIISNQKALSTYTNKLKYLKAQFDIANYGIFDKKILKFNTKINFVYSNIFNLIYNYSGMPLSNNNELAINVFYQDGFTYVIFIWEKDSIQIKKHVESLCNLTLECLKSYITKLIIAFPFNFFIKPSSFDKWEQSTMFLNEISECAKKYFFNYDYLFNVFMKENNINIFDI